MLNYLPSYIRRLFLRCAHLLSFASSQLLFVQNASSQLHSFLIRFSSFSFSQHLKEGISSSQLLIFPTSHFLTFPFSHLLSLQCGGQGFE